MNNKLKNYLFCFSGTLLLSLIFSQNSSMFAGLVMFSVGFLKEIYNNVFNKSDFDLSTLAANTLGIVSAVIILGPNYA